MQLNRRQLLASIAAASIATLPSLPSVASIARPEPTALDLFRKERAEKFERLLQSKLEWQSPARRILISDVLQGHLPQYQMESYGGKNPWRVIATPLRYGEERTWEYKMEECTDPSDVWSVPYQTSILVDPTDEGMQKALDFYLDHEKQRVLQLLNSVTLPLEESSIKYRKDVINVVCSAKGLNHLKTLGFNYYTNGHKVWVMRGHDVWRTFVIEDSTLDHHIHYLGNPDKVGVIAFWQDMTVLPVEGKLITFYDPSWAAQPGHVGFITF